MARLVVLALVLLFLIGFGALTLSAIASERVTLGSLVLAAISIFVLVILGVGAVGALRKPPRNGR